ncbi:hypothetical protein [Pseudomonas sp. p106]|uniref:hypothetical protein n=1 Tax=Pseudomonas sp. p106 TaxID=2479854 RepID=UPI000F79E432|nr:hypothetical protein [Pseudomonas sp. p106]RRV49584.1 hypothetical protein EGJ09_01210 [Pseudomonas sp. p106]
MQSADYVPGVSGWKMENGLIEMNGGPHGPVRIGSLDAEEVKPTDEQLAAICLTRQDLAEPFIVVDGITYINEGCIQEAKFTSESTDAKGQPLVEIDLKKGEISMRAAESKAQLYAQFSSSGKLVMSGLGPGLSIFEKAKSQGFSSVQDYLASFIAESQLGVDLCSQIEKISASDGIGVSQEQLDTDENFIRRIQTAAQRGAQEGCRLVLDELKRSR